MSSRSSRVRTKVTALLLSLIALWAFAAYVTVREGLNLLSVSTLDTGVGRPTDALIADLQEERRLSLVELGNNSPSTAAALVAQRAHTDTELASFKALTGTSSVNFAGTDALRARIADTVRQTDALAANRSAIDAHAIDRAGAGAAYTQMIGVGFLIFDSLSTLDDKELAKDVRTLITLSRAREVLAQEDSLLAGALASGQVTVAEKITFSQLVGTQRFLYGEGEAELPATDADNFRGFSGGAELAELRRLEERVLTSAPADTRPVSSSDWDNANQAIFTQLRGLEQAAADDVVARATPAGTWVIVRLALAGGLGLIAVIASIIVSITTARNLIRQLERLRNAALELASYRLPRVVERLQHGEKVDVDREAPPLDFGRDEIGQVGQAFNAVQETAVRVAVEQAELRRSVRDVFLSLARRSQALLHRQLGLLDAMERRSTDAEELSELFRIDHLATRMRRNAENLIVLSGATAGRAWRKPVPMVDVLRGALAEVEDYTRVTVLPVGSAPLLGRAVGDVIHLLAELIENAVSFSPPQTAVKVGGSVVGNGFAIEIEDRGLGMGQDELMAANLQLSDPPEFKLTSTARLGLYVVGQLAQRHDIRVRLTESPYGGTTAIVLLPASIMADHGRDDADGTDPDGTPALVLASGRHRQDPGAERIHLSTTAFVPGRPGEPERPSPPNGATQRFVPPGPPAAPSRSTNPVAAVEASIVDGLVETVRAPGVGISPSTGIAGPSTPAPATGAAGTTVGGTTAAASVRRSEPTILTPSGLPWRQREAPVARPTTPPAAVPTPTVPATTVPATTVPATTAPVAGPTPPPSTTIFPGPVTTTGDGAAHPLGTNGSALPPLPSRPVATTPVVATPVAPGPVAATPVAATGAPAAEPVEPPGRPLEEIRSIMSSYRSGTLRGRSDAARLVEQDGPVESVDATSVDTASVDTASAESASVDPTPVADVADDSTVDGWAPLTAWTPPEWTPPADSWAPPASTEPSTALEEHTIEPATIHPEDPRTTDEGS
jgi:signal transduction histidine kinase